MDRAPDETVFPLSLDEAWVLDLNGLDDFIACYDGTFDAADDPWMNLLLEGAKELAKRLGPAIDSRDASAYALRGEEIFYAHEALDSMSEDSPLDGCDQKTRQLAWDLVERLSEVALPYRLAHWDRLHRAAAV